MLRVYEDLVIGGVKANTTLFSSNFNNRVSLEDFVVPNS
jgi:hypothetical protein